MEQSKGILWLVYGIEVSTLSPDELGDIPTA
jgi:hypothetical protein